MGGYDTEAAYEMPEKQGWNNEDDSKKTWLNTVCRNTVPQTEVDDKLVTYNWIPPPFFMIAITIAQVIINFD
jgi:hypothetical protein